jgi:hypothetical protein
VSFQTVLPSAAGVAVKHRPTLNHNS